MAGRHCGVVALAVLTSIVAVGCGENEEATTGPTATQPPPTTVAESPTTSEAPPTTTTTTTNEEPREPPQERGATDPIEAAFAVLTDQGTPQEACALYVTPNFIETAYGGKDNCIASRTGDALAQDLSLGPAVEKGATHLVVIPVGGPYDGVKVEVELVRAGDTYRVDALDADVPAGP